MQKTLNQTLAPSPQGKQKQKLMLKTASQPA